jgi:GTP-binding protein EngB required for normal cell division
MRSRVDCGFGLTILSFSPMMRLRSVDLPAFGFPTTVTIPARGMREK